MILTDPRAFHQVMLNLMTNAADALTDRPRPIIDLEVDQDAEFAVVRVRDNGLGMTVAELAKLFKPFHTTKPNGTGLGLAIVKKMLARMGGTILVDSVQDRVPPSP